MAGALCILLCKFLPRLKKILKFPFMPNKILLIAGEASGDLLGANLARELWRHQPGLILQALGGAQMRAAGVEIIFDNRAMDIMGWVGVIKNWRIIRTAIRAIRQILNNDPPDLLILIDYPGFNLRMAKLAKARGIKVLYYVSPQIWAWKYGRINTIRRCVDHIAVLYPFEEEIYRREGVPVTYVGHPLSSLVCATDNSAAIYQRYRLDSNHPVIALFPGSRQQEVRRLMPILMAVLPKIRQHLPTAQFVLPLASTLDAGDLQPFLNDQITIVKNDTYNLLSICTAAIVKSGTGTLEVALSQVPLVVIYKGSLINYWIARTVIRVKQIGLCNIVAEKTVAKELIQRSVTPENIAAETLRLIIDSNYRNQIITDLATLRASMNRKDNSQQVAKIAVELLQRKGQVFTCKSSVARRNWPKIK
jgi:lipid-A-disaccharide synthase